MSDAIVVGGGLGGLAAAAVLAAEGWKVTVLEAGPRLGGKANILEIDGVEVDTGPSVLTLAHLVSPVFERCGARLEDEIELLEHDRAFEYHWPDGRKVTIGRGLDATLDNIARDLGSDARDEARAFLRYAQALWETAAPPFVLADRPSLGGVFKMGPRRWADLLRIDAHRSMRAGIRAYVRDPALRDIFERYATYNGSDPRVAPATLNLIAWVELGLGHYGIQGGIYSLVRALERLGRRHGVEYRTGCRVEQIDPDAGEIRLADGQHLRCKTIIANADVAHLVRDLLTQPMGLKPTDDPSTSGMTLILKARRRDRPPHAVLYPERYEAEFEDLFDHRRPPVQPTLYVCAQEPCHGRKGWTEHEPLFVMANAPAEPYGRPTDPQVWVQLEGTMLDRLRNAGWIDPDDEVVARRSPSELASTYPGSLGALYGAASNNPFAAFQRPANRISDRLYLASGSAHPGGGMPLCVQSGLTAARAVLRDHGARS